MKMGGQGRHVGSHCQHACCRAVQIEARQAEVAEPFEASNRGRVGSGSGAQSDSPGEVAVLHLQTLRVGSESAGGPSERQ